ncbi:hypothetical protein CSC12_1847 [Klebsiella michiganensis]|jgi:hypothetical protein|nr:hypothetical protein CSC12_1847 [Klebsiella michiganensis]
MIYLVISPGGITNITTVVRGFFDVNNQNIDKGPLLRVGKKQKIALSTA